MVVAMSSARDEGPLESPDRPPGVRVTTPPAGAAVPSKKMSGLASLRWRAGQRAMTRGEERLARPMGREMKPEAPHAPADAAGDFEQLEANGPDGRANTRRFRADGRRDPACPRAAAQSLPTGFSTRNVHAKFR